MSFNLLIYLSIFENGVVKKVSTISNALDNSVFPLIAITLASLSLRVSLASSTLSTFAHLIPFTLLQAIEIPIPVPQIKIP